SGSRFLSRRHPLSDLLAAVAVSRAHPGDVHGLDSAFELPWVTAVGRPARARRCAWSARLAMVVHPGRAADRLARLCVPVRPDGQTGTSVLVEHGAAGKAGRAPGGGGAR